MSLGYFLFSALLLASPNFGLSLGSSAPPHPSTVPVVLTEEEDRNDRDEYRDDERPLPIPREAQPRILTELQRGLRAGTAWVVVQNGRQRVLRVGLEFQGRVVSAVTLEPGSGDPVPYEFRNSFYPVRPLTQAQVAARLGGFRQQLAHLRLGQSGVVSGGVVQVPLLWNDRLVNYLRFDPRTGRLLTNEGYTLEQRRSPLKSR